MSDQPSTYRSTNTLAVVSLVFGIACWVVLPLIGAIVAITCGHLARGEIRRAPSATMDGDAMAVAGLVLGYLHLVLALVASLFVVALLVLGFGVGAMHW